MSEQQKGPGGRPTDYTEERLAAAERYVSGGWKESGDKVPTVVGLAAEIGVARSTCYEWAKDPQKSEFLDILTRVEEIQERALVNGGLSNDFNPAITKMMLTKHGYSDKQEIDHRSGDGSMSPKDSGAAVLAALEAKHNKKS